MAYILQADLTTPVGGNPILIELSDLDDDGAIDPVVIAQVIERSDAMVDGYLAGRYSVPIAAPVPTLVKSLSLDIARWLLASNRGIGNLELYRQNYTDAMKTLREIADGKMQLNVAVKPLGSELVTGYTGMVNQPDDFEDGGPYWDNTWRDEGLDDDDGL